jgi:hypothetical protein
VEDKEKGEREESKIRKERNRKNRKNRKQEDDFEDRGSCFGTPCSFLSESLNCLDSIGFESDFFGRSSIGRGPFFTALGRDKWYNSLLFFLQSLPFVSISSFVALVSVALFADLSYFVGSRTSTVQSECPFGIGTGGY